MPAFAHPEREAGVEPVGRTRVGILVGGDVEPARAGSFDAAQHLGHLAEVRLVRRLQMPDLGGDFRAIGNREHFVERLEDPGALRALMAEIDAAVARGDLGKLDDLVG